MTSPYLAHISAQDTVTTHQGGVAVAVDQWAQLDRFLVLGSTNGNYYVGEQALTKESAAIVATCLADDPKRTIDTIVQMVLQDRTASVDACLFAFSVALSSDDVDTRVIAYDLLPAICRIPTHLFALVQMTTKQRGWSRGLKRAIANWYELKPADRLAYHTIKYQQRGGLSHGDVIRVAHPRAVTPQHAEIYNYMRGKPFKDGFAVPDQLTAAAVLHQTFGAVGDEYAPEVAKLIATHRLPREVVPTQYLNSRDVWDALLIDMPLMATVRNLGKLSSLRMLDHGSFQLAKIVDELRDPERIKNSHIHPLDLLTAAKQYELGKGLKGSLTWMPQPEVLRALTDAFMLSFETLPKITKPVLVAVDTSGSMTGAKVAGKMNLRAVEAACVLALCLAHQTDERAGFIQFDTNVYGFPVGKHMTLNDAMRLFNGTGGGTNCALPYEFATATKGPHGIDLTDGAVVIISDYENGMGNPSLSRGKARREFANLRSVNIALAVNAFSVSADRQTLNCVGLDTAVPRLAAEFIGV